MFSYASLLKCLTLSPSASLRSDPLPSSVPLLPRPIVFGLRRRRNHRANLVYTQNQPVAMEQGNGQPPNMQSYPSQHYQQNSYVPSSQPVSTGPAPVGQYNPCKLPLLLLPSRSEGRRIRLERKANRASFLACLLSLPPHSHRTIQRRQRPSSLLPRKPQLFHLRSSRRSPSWKRNLRHDVRAARASPARRDDEGSGRRIERSLDLRSSRRTSS
jgi:hypothetical protein